jgi:hypothetical protein
MRILIPQVSLIPSGISSDCNATLTAFNTDASVSSCIQPLIDATASFSPLSTVKLDSSDINYALASICKSGAGCSDTTVRQWISRVSSACSAELTGSSPNAQVRELYDLLYIVQPLKGAVCAIDSANQKYCVNSLRESVAASGSASSGSPSASASGSATSSGAAPSGSANATAGTNSLFASYAVDLPTPVKIAAENLYIVINSASDFARRMFIAERQSSDSASSNFATVIAPNVTTYRSTNLPFLFLQPSMTSDELCTPCTREIMVSYIKWETQVPYALGLSQSPTLGGQMDIYNAINSTCGANYINAINSQVQQYVGNTNSTSGALTQVGSPAGAGGAIAFAAVVAGVVALVA